MGSSRDGSARKKLKGQALSLGLGEKHVGKWVVLVGLDKKVGG